MGKPTGKQKGITFGYCDDASGARVYPPPVMAAGDDLLPEQLPPTQKVVKISEEHGMIASVTSWPPLGQATTIAKEAESVKFTVLLESNSPQLLQDDEISVCIWHNHDDSHEWCDLLMSETWEFDNLVGRNMDPMAFTSLTHIDGRPPVQASRTPMVYC